MPFGARQMDLEAIMLSEISQTEKDQYHDYLTYMWNLKQNKTKQMNTQNKNRLTDSESKQVVARGEVGGALGEIGEGDSEVQTSSLKQISQGI